MDVCWEDSQVMAVIMIMSPCKRLNRPGLIWIEKLLPAKNSIAVFPNYTIWENSVNWE